MIDQQKTSTPNATINDPPSTKTTQKSTTKPRRATRRRRAAQSSHHSDDDSGTESDRGSLTDASSIQNDDSEDEIPDDEPKKPQPLIKSSQIVPPLPKVPATKSKPKPKAKSKPKKSNQALPTTSAPPVAPPSVFSNTTPMIWADQPADDKIEDVTFEEFDITSANNEGAGASKPVVPKEKKELSEEAKKKFEAKKEKKKLKMKEKRKAEKEAKALAKKNGVKLGSDEKAGETSKPSVGDEKGVSGGGEASKVVSKGEKAEVAEVKGPEDGGWGEGASSKVIAEGGKVEPTSTVAKGRGKKSTAPVAADDGGWGEGVPSKVVAQGGSDQPSAPIPPDDGGWGEGAPSRNITNGNPTTSNRPGPPKFNSNQAMRPPHAGPSTDRINRPLTQPNQFSGRPTLPPFATHSRPPHHNNGDFNNGLAGTRRVGEYGPSQQPGMRGMPNGFGRGFRGRGRGFGPGQGFGHHQLPSQGQTYIDRRFNTDEAGQGGLSSGQLVINGDGGKRVRINGNEKAQSATGGPSGFSNGYGPQAVQGMQGRQAQMMDGNNDMRGGFIPGRGRGIGRGAQPFQTRPPFQPRPMTQSLDQVSTPEPESISPDPLPDLSTSVDPLPDLSASFASTQISEEQQPIHLSVEDLLPVTAGVTVHLPRSSSSSRQSVATPLTAPSHPSSPPLPISPAVIQPTPPATSAQAQGSIIPSHFRNPAPPIPSPSPLPTHLTGGSHRSHHQTPSPFIHGSDNGSTSSSHFTPPLPPFLPPGIGMYSNGEYYNIANGAPVDFHPAVPSPNQYRQNPSPGHSRPNSGFSTGGNQYPSIPYPTHPTTFNDHNRSDSPFSTTTHMITPYQPPIPESLVYFSPPAPSRRISIRDPSSPAHDEIELPTNNNNTRIKSQSQSPALKSKSKLGTSGNTFIPAQSYDELEDDQQYYAQPYNPYIGGQEGYNYWQQGQGHGYSQEGYEYQGPGYGY